MRRGHGRDRSRNSYAEVRSLALVLGVGSAVLLLPFVLRAIDLNGDNLDDAWEAQYGFSTNAYDATNLAGWWQMDGGTNVADRSANHVDGTLQGFTTNAFVGGLFSNALNVTPRAWVDFPADPALDLTNGFTFSAWVKTPYNSDRAATLARWSDATTNAWTLRMGGDGLPHLQFTDASGRSLATVGAPSGPDPNLLNDGAWHHLAATWNAQQGAIVYVDGDSQGKGFVAQWTPGPVASFTLGDPNGVADYLLDEVRLYNRALSAKEIAQLPVTYTDLTGNGVSVFEAEQRGLNPFSAYPPKITEAPASEKKPADADAGADSGWTPWMAHADLDKFMSQFDSVPPGHHPNYWDKGHWLTGVEGRWANNRIEYRISYGPVPAHKHYGWYWWINQPEDVFQKRAANYTAHGFTLQHSNFLTRPTGEKRYQGVWHWLQAPGPTTPASSAEVQRALEENKPQQL